MAIVQLRQRLKKAVKNLPYVQGLFQYNADLTAQNRQLQAERSQLIADLAKVQADCQSLREDRQQLTEAGEEVHVELKQLENQNTRLLIKLSRVNSSNHPEIKLQEAEEEEDEPVNPLWVPPGHFYSPIPDLAETQAYDAALPWQPPETLLGIDLNQAGQFALLEKFKDYYAEIPFGSEPKEGLRYFFNNVNFSYGDGITLYSMLRHLRPRRLIEIGSGYSSQLILDTNELFLENSTVCTFIEPYPKLLFSLLKAKDREQVRIIPTRLQEIDLAVFEELEAEDVLFVDSTHVSKFNSDVNLLLLEILPRLKPGVYIHFHDIIYPFEYHLSWLKENRAWNEAYILRAFLEYNAAFEIVFFNSFLQTFYQDWFKENMPLCLRNPGASIWLKKR